MLAMDAVLTFCFVHIVTWNVVANKPFKTSDVRGMYSNVFIHIEGRRLKYANVSCIINLCEWLLFAGFGLTSANGYRLLGSAVMMSTCVINAVYLSTSADGFPFAGYGINAVYLSTSADGFPFAGVWH